MRRAALTLALALILATAAGVVGRQGPNAQQASADPRVADLVRTGRVRVGLGLVPTFATRDPASGELRGVAMDLARALAARLGVEVVPVEYPSPPAVLDGVAAGAWDVAFLGVDPSRAAVVDFSPPYQRVDATYLVPADSPIRTIADADRPGVRVAVTRNSVEERVLAPMLRQAELVRVATIGAGFDALRGGGAEVFAAPRPTLLRFAAQLPGSRVLEDRFHATFGAMAVPKSQAGRLAYVSDFIEEAKASGLVQRAIERAGLHGVEVALPGNPGAR